MYKKYKLRDFDFRLVVLAIIASSISILAVNSANADYLKKQVIGVVVGIIIMLVLAFIDYNSILRFNWIMYVAIVGVLVLTLFSSAGDSAGGAKRWIEIGSFRFQPSELAKIVLILFFAQYIMKRKKSINKASTLLSMIGLVAIPAYLIFEQPDLSTTIVVMAIFCAILFVAEISWRYIVTALAIVIPIMAVFVVLAIQPNNELLKPHQKQRILAFIDPEQYADSTAYQQINSEIAIASGQLNGKGYKNNEVTSVKNGRYILEPHTDFIFAVIGEELGFRGSVFLVVTLFSIVLECLYVSYRAKDTAGRIIAAGVASWIGIQTFINLGVVTFIIPNTGLPLPFISYGLTSLWCLYIALGFVLNVRLQAKKSGEVYE